MRRTPKLWQVIARCGESSEQSGCDELEMARLWVSNSVIDTGIGSVEGMHAEADV
jgi:hypothetical protein